MRRDARRGHESHAADELQIGHLRDIHLINLGHYPRDHEGESAERDPKQERPQPSDQEPDYGSARVAVQQIVNGRSNTPRRRNDENGQERLAYRARITRQLRVQLRLGQRCAPHPANQLPYGGGHAHRSNALPS